MLQILLHYLHLMMKHPSSVMCRSTPMMKKYHTLMMAMAMKWFDASTSLSAEDDCGDAYGEKWKLRRKWIAQQWLENEAFLLRGSLVWWKDRALSTSNFSASHRGSSFKYKYSEASPICSQLFCMGYVDASCPIDTELIDKRWFCQCGVSLDFKSWKKVFFFFLIIVL